MKKLLPLIGITAACAACCAIPLLTAFTGIAASGAGAVLLGWKAGFALLIIAGAVFWIRHRTKRAKACASVLETSCGCGTSSSQEGQVTAQTYACNIKKTNET